MSGIHFTIPGEPRGKGRPRFTRQGIAYTPKETVEYEERVRRAYIAKQGNHRAFDGKRNISCDIAAYFPIPKSTPQKQVEAMLSGQIRPTKKPDFDNITKIILDALNPVKGKRTGVLLFQGAFDDDARVVDGRCRKFYGEPARVEVRLTEIETPMPIANTCPSV
jgi:Holliday junction resolvase RusA-like endonuclease